MDTFIVTAIQNGLHLKSFLKEYGISTHSYRNLVEKSGIYVNGQLARTNLTVQTGDQVSFNWLEEASEVIPQTSPYQLGAESQKEPDPLVLPIVFEDEALLVINKPAGMLVHPTGPFLGDSLVNYVAGYLQEQGLPLYLHPITRLDRNTSGLIIMAKKAYIQAALERQVLHKEYLGIVEGLPSAPSGSITDPIGRKFGSIIERAVNGINAKPARTDWEVVQTYPKVSLVRFILHTGRTHQIRVHAAYQGHPLVGDNLYGLQPGPQSRHCLHAYKLSFVHPLTHEPLSFTLPLPEDMRKILELAYTK